MDVGGSPRARPISRCAIAKRVTESIIKSTSSPCRLKYSATLIALKAPYFLMRALSSLVATTMTVLLRSLPRFFAMNSGTSRPRSPISATTFTGASHPFTIMPISVDLPTPLPAKMPTFCPLPAVSSPSMLFMPTLKGSSMSPRFITSIGAFIICSNSSRWSGPLPSIGFIKGSTTRPRRFSPTGISRLRRLSSTLSPTFMPSMKPNGDIVNVSPPRDVTIPRRRFPSERIVTLWPILAFRPVATMALEPILTMVPYVGESVMELTRLRRDLSGISSGGAAAR